MRVRRDHIAGLFFIVGGVAIWLLSGDLPIGSLSFPGAGMMPKLVIAIMVMLALVALIAAGSSPSLRDIDWSDAPHALRVLAVAIPAVALYTTAGFVITMTVMLFALLFVIERKSLLVSTVFSVGVAGFAYVMFGTFLKSPLPQGILGF